MMCETPAVDLVIVRVRGVPKHDTSEVFWWRIIVEQKVQNLLRGEVKYAIGVGSCVCRRRETDQHLCGRIGAYLNGIYPTVQSETVVVWVVKEVTRGTTAGVVELDEYEIEPRGQDNTEKIQIREFALGRR